MLFSSITFLSIFLPAVLVSYYLIPTIKAKNCFLLIASFVFYAWGEGYWTLVLIVSILINYVFGFYVAQALGRPQAKFLVGLCVVANVLLLGYFKYFNFAMRQANNVLGLAGMSPIAFALVHLPLGISFYTFHGLTYNVNVYRRQARTQSLMNVALYKAFFPQLIAGPIVRYHLIAKALEDRSVTLKLFARGTERFILGLAKKVLIANTVAVPVNAIFALKPDQLTFETSWFGIGCYALQIYFDFSGYSDMAIGLALMFGFRFPENFNYPYISQSVREFWRRWHMTLSNFFRDYVYIPLGGNRKGTLRKYANLIFVFFLTGLWHGASWTFVIWGFFHGFWIVLEHAFLGRLLEWMPAVFRHAYLLLVVVVAWVFFRSPDLSYALACIDAMFTSHHLFATYPEQSISFYLDSRIGLAVLLGCLFSMPLLAFLGRLSASHRALAFVARSPLAGTFGSVAPLARSAGLLALFSICWVVLAAGTYNPFIYFRF